MLASTRSIILEAMKSIKLTLRKPRFVDLKPYTLYMFKPGEHTVRIEALPENTQRTDGHKRYVARYAWEDYDYAGYYGYGSSAHPAHTPHSDAVRRYYLQSLGIRPNVVHTERVEHAAPSAVEPSTTTKKGA